MQKSSEPVPLQAATQYKTYDNTTANTELIKYRASLDQWSSLYSALVISVLLYYCSETWTLLKADERRLEAFHMNCRRRILGIRWFLFVTNGSVTSQTGEEGLAIRICRRRLSIFGHVRRLPEATPAHSALRLAVDTRAVVNRTSGRNGSASVDDPAERGWSRSRTTLGSTPTTPGGSHMTVSLGGRYTTRGRSSVPASDRVTDHLILAS